MAKRRVRRSGEEWSSDLGAGALSTQIDRKNILGTQVGHKWIACPAGHHQTKMLKRAHSFHPLSAARMHKSMEYDAADWDPWLSAIRRLAALGQPTGGSKTFRNSHTNVANESRTTDLLSHNAVPHSRHHNICNAGLVRGIAWQLSFKYKRNLEQETATGAQINWVMFWRRNRGLCSRKGRGMSRVKHRWVTYHSGRSS